MVAVGPPTTFNATISSGHISGAAGSTIGDIGVGFTVIVTFVGGEGQVPSNEVAAYTVVVFGAA